VKTKRRVAFVAVKEKRKVEISQSGLRLISKYINKKESLKKVIIERLKIELEK
jgi:hypothetical protein